MSASLPSPVGGWNALDSLADMDATDAVILQNFFPRTTSVDLRDGYTRWATGFPAAVETIMAYNSNVTGSDALFGISGSSIYDATAGGVVGAAVYTGLSSAQRCQYVNIATPGGNYLWMCNGLDNPVTFDGAVWANPAIAGVTPASLTNVNLHKNRLWAVERSSLKAWYLPVQSIAGTMQALDLSSFCRLGGFLRAMGTWTIDAGYGVDDLAVFATSEGEVLVFRGTDPSSASTWALVGIWNVGAPIGKRCFMKYGGDLLLICQDGILPLSAGLQSSRTNPKATISYKILQAISEVITNYGSNFGWQLIQYPSENMLILNVPIDNMNQQQYVMNTITKSWCNFTGWNANCWELFGNVNPQPYFGGQGFIGKAWSGTTDAGSNINATALQAFNYFGDRAKSKRWTMMRPVFNSTGTPSLYANVNVDFDTSDTTATLAFSPSSASLWDTALWDSGTWAGSTILKNWQGVTGVGYCAAPRIKIASANIDLKWMSTDLVMERGGIL